ncbi:MAG: UDP-N-acetylmuramate dehydrogenase [Candidatus Firestonebacteria bacterium]
MKINENLSKYTTLGLGGPADCMLDVLNLRALKKVLLFAKEEKLPLTLIGGGSNILVKDGGIRGLVLRLKGKFLAISVRDNEIICGGGAVLSRAVIIAAAKGLTGLEFAAGIPGTIGGAVVMNAGADGGEIKDVVKSITVIDRNSKIKKLSGKKAGFTYRGAKFSGKGRLIVIEVSFSLKKSSEKTVKAKILEFLKRRKNRQPACWGTAGSVFKNPKGFFAGRLVDECGLKGRKIGKVEISMKHGNFFVNRGKSTKDFIKLMELVKKTVFKKIGVRLAAEIKILGEDK